MPTIRYSRIVHLSHVISPDMPHWPGDPALELETVADRSVHGYYLRRLAIGEHSATHVNAPASFSAGGLTIDQYAADRLVVPAVVLNVRVAADADADYLATPRDLDVWEDLHGALPAGCAVLLDTGWAARWDNPDAFLNRDADGVMHFPGFSPELAEMLLDRRHAAGIGIDTHGVDGGRDDRFVVNAFVLARCGLVLENLANLDGLPPSGSTIAIGILRLQAGSGSPAAIVAFVP